MYFQFLEPAPIKYQQPSSMMNLGDDSSMEQLQNCIKISRLLIDPQLTLVERVLAKGHQLE